MIDHPVPQSRRYKSKGKGKLGAIAGAIALLSLAALFGAAVPTLGALVPMAVILASVGLWVMLDFRVGVAFAVVIMPLSPLSFFPREMFGIRGLNPLNLILIATIVSYIVHAGLRRWKDPIAPGRLLGWYILPILLACLVGMNNVSLIPPRFEAERLIQFHDAFGYLRDVFIKPQFLVMLSLMVGLSVRHSKHPEKFMYLMLASGWVLCALMSWLLLTSGMSLRQLASPLARTFLGKLNMHANELSLVLNMLYALTLFSIREEIPSHIRRIFFISAIVFAVCVLMTFSRGGFVGFVLINLIYFWKRISVKTVITGILVAGCIGPFVLGPIMERALTGVEGGDRGAVTAGRVDGIWLPLLPYVLAEPVLPHGVFSILWSPPVRLNKMLPVAQTHSAWLGGLMDMGVVGFGFMLAFLWFVRREFTRLSQEHAVPALQGMFAGGAVLVPLWFIQGVTDDHFTPTFAQSYFWIALGILMGCGGVFRHKKKGMDPNKFKAPVFPTDEYGNIRKGK